MSGLPDPRDALRRSADPPAAAEGLRVLAIDDTPAILADYFRILCPSPAPGRPGAGGGGDAALDDLEAELFGEASAAAGDAEAAPVWLEVANSGEEGLTLAEAAVREGRPFGVAFVDMRMAGGWDGVRTIRELFAADPGIQVVVATAYSDRGLDAIGRDFHRNDQLLILKKPFDAVEVRQAAAALSAKRRMTEAAALRMEELDRRVAARTAQIHRMATLDGLTGLPNRQVLLDRLAELVAHETDRRAEEGTATAADGFALLFMDFNRFKLINDSLGHDIGDLLLQSIAGRIRGLEENVARAAAGSDATASPIRGPLTGYRLGGDEFVLLLEGVPCGTAAGDIAAAAIEAFETPHEAGPHRCVSHPSIGLASSFRPVLHPAELLRDADLAMFEAKRQGRASGRPACVAYEGAMHAAAQRRMTLEVDLRAAVEADALDLRFQPIRDASDASRVGVEALLSWVHPALGRVENHEIIRVAEDSELIHPLGVWVRRAALRAACRLNPEGPPAAPRVPVHANVSMRELLTPGFAAGVRAQVSEAGLPEGSLVLEVSEVGIDRQSEAVALAIHELHAHGLPVVLDEFGRERSSLAFLAELPLRAVKIDRFFVGEVGGHPARMQVLQAIVGFAKSLSLGTFACGIETREQLAAVQAIGVEGVQGFLTGRPVSLDEFLATRDERPEVAVAEPVAGPSPIRSAA